MTLMDLFEEAVREREQAFRNFNAAKEEYIDAAIWALKEKDEKLRIIIRELKKEPGKAPVEKEMRKFIRNNITMLEVK